MCEGESAPISTHAMRPADSVQRFDIEGGLLLLDPVRSRLFAYNDTARHAWDLIEAGRGEKDLVAEFAQAWDIPATLAQRDIETILAQWRGEGLVAAAETPAQPLAATAGATPNQDRGLPPQLTAEWTCTIGQMTIAFAIASDRPMPIRTVLAHLETPGACPQARIEITTAPSGELVLMAGGVERSRTSDVALLIGGVWQSILELIHPGVEWLAIIHGGAIERDGEGIVLCGPSGSGKSTLTAGLVSAGHGYLADDLAAISAPDGMIVPWPAPMSLKPGSFEVIAPHRPDLAQAPRYRTKGVEARLLAPPPAAFDMAPVPMRYLIFPRFTSGASPELEALTSFQALERLLADRIWMGHPITAERVSALVALLDRTPAFQAVYGTLEDGMRLVEDVA
jgi:hypothetical protein